MLNPWFSSETPYCLSLPFGNILQVIIFHYRNRKDLYIPSPEKASQLAYFQYEYAGSPEAFIWVSGHTTRCNWVGRGPAEQGYFEPRTSIICDVSEALSDVCAVR